MKLSAVIFDLDGTIYRGDEVIPGAVDFVEKLQTMGIHVLFYTNRAYRTAQQIADKLRRMSFNVAANSVLTSGLVTARALRGQRVFCIGEQPLLDALDRECILVNEEIPDVVVVGYVDNLDMKVLTEAVRYISHNDARFVATNLDPYIVVGGERVPENGAIAAAVQCATDLSPEVYGKPDPFGINMVLEKYNLPPEEVMIVGDTVSTDIKCGKNAGIRTALVLTGVTSAAEAPDSEAELIASDYLDLWMKIFGMKEG